MQPIHYPCQSLSGLNQSEVFFLECLLYDFRLLFLKVVILFQIMVEHFRRKSFVC